MSMKEITVKRYVSPSDFSCVYEGDYFGSDVCPYHVFRDITHGNKAPIERHVPKCTLFDVWLDSPYAKCTQCKSACAKADKKEVY